MKFFALKDDIANQYKKEFLITRQSVDSFTSLMHKDLSDAMKQQDKFTNKGLEWEAATKNSFNQFQVNLLRKKLVIII